MDGPPETRDLSELFNFYRQALLNLTQLRKVNDASLRQLADAFRGQQGENHIIVLFEREFRPVPRREALNILADMPKFAFQANEMFLTGGNKEPFDANALSRILQAGEADPALHLPHRQENVGHRQPAGELGRHLLHLQQDRRSHGRILPGDRRARGRAESRAQNLEGSQVGKTC